MISSAYDNSFFSKHSEGSLASARIVLPHVLGIVKPASVLDVGCGVGAWLKAALELGVPDIVGVDGDYVARDQLLIPPTSFKALDLAKPFDLGRKFDLALSLEVAEHISPSAADVFVQNLVLHSPIVLFSAAIPCQDGNCHVNEQWPDYWAARFAVHGYECLDWIRQIIWNDGRVDVWYRQNVFVYVHHEYRKARAALLDQTNCHMPVGLVHPELFTQLINQPIGMRRILKVGPAALRRSIHARLAKLTGR